MGKKEKIPLQYSDDLEAIDAALSDAMQHLDATNERVVELLRACEPPKPEGAPQGATMAEGTAGPQPAGAAEVSGAESRVEDGSDAG